MAESKAKGSARDAGQAQVQRTFDEAHEKGYMGERPAGSIDNREYTLLSGPDSPSPLEEHLAIHDARKSAMEASKGDN